MSVIGTKKIWKPAPGAGLTQIENQILKNAGYISIQLYAVNYMSLGNFWQKTFGGTDNIVLTTNLVYQNGVNCIDATSIQDVRNVNVNHNYNFGLQQNIAVKVPANADYISISVKMTAIKDDLLHAKFEMLNKAEYKSALQLAPTVIGQIITITSLVKKLFSDSDPKSQLEASYAGIISSQSSSNPISNGKLTTGYLIMLSTNDGEKFDNIDENKFEIRGDTLYYDDKQVENTYVIFNVSFESLKGEDEKANWFKKYNEALNNLDKIQLTNDISRISLIYEDSKAMWIDGNALLNADDTYINSEKISIRNAALKTIKDKYEELFADGRLIITEDILRGLYGPTSPKNRKEALPVKMRLGRKEIIYSASPIAFGVFDNITKETSFKKLIDKEANVYLDELKTNNLNFELGKLQNLA